MNGNTFTLGNWMKGEQSLNGFGLTFSDATNHQPATIDFSAVRAATDWTWSHATADGTSSHVTNMRVDATGRLMLYDPANPRTPAVILDPAGKSSHLEPQGDLSMGSFQATPQ